MAKVFQTQIATGNDLLEGDVVYFAETGRWTRRIKEAELAKTREAAEDLMSRASDYPNEVVGVYLVDVSVDADGRAVPNHFREEFRMRGPSNRPAHGRAAEEV